VDVARFSCDDYAIRWSSASGFVDDIKFSNNGVNGKVGRMAAPRAELLSTNVGLLLFCRQK